MKEIITLQFGPYANHVGAHVWSMQDEWAANHTPADGDVDGGARDGDDDEYERSVTLRRSSTHDGRREFHVPRLVLVDRQGQLGIVGQRGLQFVAPFEAVADAELAAASETWGGGSVAVSAVDIFAPHPFVSQLRQQAEGEGEEEYGEEEDANDDAHADARADAADAHEADDNDAAAEPGRAGASRRFDFKASVGHWSDFLACDLHPGSLHELYDFVHGYSNLERFHEGHALFGSALGGVGGAESADALVERIRRELEMCERAQGLVVLTDVDSAFGGMAHAALLAVADELGRIDSLTFGLQAPPAERAAAAAPAADAAADAAESGASAPRAKPTAEHVVANRALALSALSQSSSFYVPLSTAGLAPADVPLVRSELGSWWEASAVLAAAVDTLVAPCRALRADAHRPIGWLTATASVTDSTRIGALACALPALRYDDESAGAWRGGAPLCPLLPWSSALRLAPIAHLLAARGCDTLLPPDLDSAPTGPEAAWHANRARDSWWAAPAPSARHQLLRLRGALELPVCFPQFFAPSVARCLGQRRGARTELLTVPIYSRLENSPLLGRGVRDAGVALKRGARAIARAPSAGEAAESLEETCEHLAQVAEDYAGCAQVGGETLLDDV
jgi:hypothetical protein